MGVTPQQTDDPPPSVVEATPTLIDKFRGRNTLIKVARTATARREAKRQAAEDHRKSVARRIALYLRRGVCDHRGNALEKEASAALLRTAMRLAGDRKLLGRALRAAQDFMKDELLYEEELQDQGGLDDAFVRSADSLTQLPLQPVRPNLRTLRPVTLLRLVGREVERDQDPEAALDSLLYRASKLLSDFENESPRPAPAEIACPSPDRQSRARLDSRCFDSEAIFRKREASLRTSRGALDPVEELPDEDDQSVTPFKEVERRETVKERRKADKKGGKKKLSAQIAKESAFLMELDALDAKKLIDAACLNRTKAVMAIIKKSADHVPGAPTLDELFTTLHPQTGYAALHAAVEFNRMTCVKAMLENGAQINSPLSPLQRTPLHIAALQCSVDLVSLLKERGADHMILDEQFKRAFELVPEERASSDPLISVMRESLKDGPDHVESTAIKRTAQRSFEVHWDILGDDIASTAASTRFFRVNWDQPVERAEMPEYASVLASVDPPLQCTCPSTPKQEGVVLRHVIRSERVRNEFTEAKHITFEEEIKGVSLVARLWPSTRYVAFVRASNAAGLGTPSPPAVTFTTPDLPEPPGAPFLLHVTEFSVIAGWLPPRYSNGRDVESYELQRYVVGGTRAEKFRKALALNPDPKKAAKLVKEWTSMTRPAGETSDDGNDWNIERREWMSNSFHLKDRALFSFAGLSLGEKVCLRVRCQSVLGWSRWSRISTTFETGRSIYVTDITSRWDANAVRAQHWELQVQLQRGGADPWETVCDDIAPASVVQRKVNALMPGGAYRFRVRPKDSFGWREWDFGLVTDTVRLKEDVPDPPTVPVGDRHKATEKSIEVAWTPTHDNGQPVTLYELQHVLCSDQEDDFGGAPSVQVIAVHRSYTLTGCITGSQYVFRVRAKNKHGWSPYSRASAACSTSTILPPGVPALREAGATWLDVQWARAPNGGVVRYEVEYQEVRPAVWRGGASHAWRSLACEELRDDRIVLPDLRPQKAYECRVRALTLEGFSVFTDPSEPMRTGRRY